MQYGITRQKSKNPHDVFDLTSIEFSEKEICKLFLIIIILILKSNSVTSGLPPYNEDDFNKELLKDPF